MTAATTPPPAPPPPRPRGRLTLPSAAAAAASDQLTRAVARLAARGRRPRCADPADHGLWLSEDQAERDQAATWCAGCPILAECGSAAGAHREQFGIWAGVDRTGWRRPRPRRPG